MSFLALHSNLLSFTSILWLNTGINIGALQVDICILIKPPIACTSLNIGPTKALHLLFAAQTGGFSMSIQL